MCRALLIFSIFLFTSCLLPDHLLAQDDSLFGKWDFTGYEEFGVVHSADSLKKSWIEFKNNGSYNWQRNDSIVSGSWYYNPKTHFLFFFDKDHPNGYHYILKSHQASELIIEFQTPDLVRTRYHFKRQ
jgi:hypothetical protein